METLKQQAFTFLDSLFENLENDGIEVDQFEMDHICYRVETNEDFHKKKEEWASFTSLFHESIIGARPIAILKLNKPWEYRGRSIQFIELPAPKPNRFYPEGFEHAEFVIDSSFKTFLLKYEKFEFNKKGMSKTLNADVKRMYEQLSVKFHKLAIDKVIALEKQIQNN
jgi:predicted metalloenzyme YecM